ncbi:SPOR domain-containing protein [Parasphingopyxis marina]|uniref:Tetratricopeptide repeat protein n=1 Tax=Parasphingopyxis marina TaxID=2761622 RepID=A0A842HZW5_9SPHN|nr:SPOR domain-containing protein [Parasphingopyxis marina]MBC2778107.1 tetratricopeptide repeat protein [Parasphingopyxis marina]
MKPTLVKLAASTMLVGASVAGVSPLVQQAVSTGTSASETQAARAASEAAGVARAALGRGDSAAAVSSAERAVEFMPNSAEYRHLLGRAYLAAGRFNSAETSFQDALTLNPDLDRTAFNLALVQIAQGDRADALAELNALEGRIGASDLGLAMALAGNHDRAIEVLRQAAQVEGGDPRARQNLALTYAMAGRWAESRITAAQDVSAAELNSRMQEWAQFAAAERQPDQVASLLGVSPNAGDPGQPVQLALNAAPTPVMTADAETQNAVVAYTAPAEDDYSVARSIDEVDVPETITADSTPVRVAAADGFVVEDEDEGQWVAADEAIAAAAPAPVAPRAAPVRISALPAPQATSAGRYVVQIGAFEQEALVSVAWDRAVSRNAELAQYEPRRTVFQHGQTYHRLSFGGFDNWAEANTLCRSLKTRGQQCFVRERVADAPTRAAAVTPASASVSVAVATAERGGRGWFAGRLRGDVVASRETGATSGWFA